MSGKRVLLGFSGGIDSCHAARSLMSQGYVVTALYMDMTGDSAQADYARVGAAETGIMFRSIDLRERFALAVIDYFTDEYASGRTPAPCTVCNRDIKWETLYEVARREGFDRIATGHYFNVERDGSRYYVTKASDPVKDQSYYLWPLGQDVLAMALTPMGNVIKAGIGRSPGTVRQQKESMGVCFLGGRPCADFLRERLGGRTGCGDITDKRGRVIGRHDGTPYYTIGQKRGLCLPAGLCVTGIDASGNLLVAGRDEDLYHRNLIISGCNIVDMDEALTAADITVKIRGIGRNPEKPCRITPRPGGLHILLDDPAWAPAAGQPVVLYRGDRVIGGGFLEDYY